MCGIAGIASKNTRLITQQRIAQATNMLAHRGPEAEGYYINENSTVALGHRRLSVMDIRSEAGQPMPYANRYYIVYNGELYNYIELRQTLLQKGYTFYTDCDTEVVVAAYAAYGEDCLQYFHGMFAFAIWDEQEQQLFAARDRFGEKPFFYYIDEEQFLFASEMKALWHMGVQKDINASMLYNYIAIGYTSNPTEPSETFYQHIYKLPAACFLQYSIAAHELTIERYWQLDMDVNNTITEVQALEQFHQLLSDSVNKRLRSDVAIGTSLSGGLDSSAIVAYCAQQQSVHYTHKCFTAIFPGFEQNEEAYAKKVAEQYQLQHYLINMNADTLISDMERLLYYQEEPVTSSSALAQYKVYEVAKQQGVTVILDGQGADEILAGYSKYYKWYWQELYRQKGLTKSGERLAAQSLGVNEPFTIKNKMAAVLPEFAASMLQSKKAKAAYRHPYFNSDFAFANKRNSYYTTPTHFTLNGALYFNTVVYGLEELLRYADRNSSAHAVEVRLPFLSHLLVEFLFSLPPQFKIKNGWTKWLLRKAAEPLLPHDIVWRKDKVGFEPPQKLWMQQKAIQEMIYEGKKTLVQNDILKHSVLHKKIQPQSAYAADNFDWRYWMASFLYKAL